MVQYEHFHGSLAPAPVEMGATYNDISRFHRFSERSARLAARISHRPVYHNPEVRRYVQELPETRIIHGGALTPREEGKTESKCLCCQAAVLDT